MRNILIGLVLIAFALGAGYFWHPAATDGESARATVTAFGKQLQKVSLLAPDASSTIASVYAPYVTPALLASWESNVAHAPGRQVSSPWPDQIQITNVAQQGNGYVVTGGIVLMTSDGLAGVIPVVIQVVPQDGKWLIAAYQEQATTTVE